MSNPMYIVVEALSAEKLQALVNNNIEAGYIVMGGVSVSCHFSGDIYYTQAMIRNMGYGV